MPKLKLVADNATNSELARGINQLHSCLEMHITNTEDNFKATTGEINEIKGIVSDIRTNQRLIAQTFKVVDQHDNPNPSKPNILGLMTEKEAFFKGGLAIGSGISAVFAIWKFVGFAAPFAWEFLKALNRSILG